MRNIYLIRHAQTEYNRLRIVQGSGVDSDLNDWGRGQALAFYNRYKDIDFDLMYTSSLKRTYQTVERFHTENSIKLIQTPLIDEICWGEFEGQKGTVTMKQKYDELNAEWSAGNLDFAFTGAESALELGRRLAKFIQLIETNEAENVLICSHGRSIKALVCLLKKESLAKMDKYHYSNTALNIVEYDGQNYTFTVENNSEHLPQRA